MVLRRQLSSGVLTPSRGRQDSVRSDSLAAELRPGAPKGLCTQQQSRKPREPETLQAGSLRLRNCLGNRKTSSEHVSVGVAECSQLRGSHT